VSGIERMMVAGVDEIVRLIRPRPPYVEACRRAVRYAVEAVRHPIRMVTAKEERDGLLKVAAKLSAARRIAGNLFFDGRVPGLDEKLDQLIADCEARIKKMKVKRSGGRGGSLLAEQKRIAADKAFDLLTVQGRRVPRLTKDGDYIKLAALLFKVATGRRSDPTRACSKLLKDVRTASS
jgi:hypothetical protein